MSEGAANSASTDVSVRPAGMSPHFQRLHAIRARLQALDLTSSIQLFELTGFDRVLKTTISLCPQCLQHIPGLVFVRSGKVWMKKQCPEHGFFDALLENDEQFYFLSNKDVWGRCFDPEKVFELPRYVAPVAKTDSCCCAGGGCGPKSSQPPEPDLSGSFTSQMSNKSCMIFVEVTNACNLACPVCYSDAKGDRKLPLEKFKQYITRLIEAKGGLDSVQLTGGEAVLHPEFWQMVSFLYEQQVKKIYLPTNGILFAKAETAERLSEFRKKVMLQLQFDGKVDETNAGLRNAELTRVRQEALAHAQRLDIQTQITMTLAHGLNEHEVGWVVAEGMKRSNIKVIALQPVTYSGRYELRQEPIDRLTLSDIVKAVVAQARPVTESADYVPIPCSHPNCGWVTLFVRRFGMTKNIVKHVDLPRAMNSVANKSLLTSAELREAVASHEGGILRRITGAVGRRLVRSKDILTIGIKPYMDRFNYDQDRIENCCTHLLNTNGEPVSFCEYNALVRERDTWERWPKVDSRDNNS